VARRCTRHPSHLAVLVGAVTGLISVEAMASPFRFEVTADTLLANYTSTERRDDGAPFNRENGILTGLSLGATVLRGPWQLELVGTLGVGTIDYEGETQLGLPLASQTHLEHAQLEVSPVYQIGKTPLFFGASLQARRIDRRIEATPIAEGLHETLSQVQLGPQVGARWDFRFGLRAVVFAEALWAFHSVLDVDFEGMFDNGHLSLPGNYAARGGLAVSYPVFRNLAVAAEASAESFSPARSGTVPLTADGVQVGIYNYPGSVQVQQTLYVGMRFYF
jgi:hypothetical protein